MSRSTDIAGLLRKAGQAQTDVERIALIRQAEELKSQQHTAAFTDKWSADDAVNNFGPVPTPSHQLLRTAAADTDWIMDLDQSHDPKQAVQEMVAEASLWWNRTSDEVKAYADEYKIQAEGLAHYLAGRYGDVADQAERAFLDETMRLRTTAVHAGLIKEADAGQSPKNGKSGEQEHFEKTVEKRIDDNKDGKPPVNKAASYEDDADDIQAEKAEDEFPLVTSSRGRSFHAGANDLFTSLAAVEGDPGVYHDDPAAVNSNRAPVLQELDSNSQDVVPVNDPGLGQTDDLTGANGTRAEEDHASKRPFPVQGTKKESSMTQQYRACPTCSGHGRVAVRHEAASGLPQIDEIADSKDNPSTTNYPADVAFPWVMDPQTDVANSIQQAEQQIAQRNSLSPLQQGRSRQNATPPRQSVQSAYHTAGGRDNSGWMGDNGARGVDYPGEQVGQYPAPSTSEGYVDPVYGQGGDNGNQPHKPYGAQEADDYTNNPGQNWQPGQPTQDDQGWREVVGQDPALQAAAAFIEQRRQAYLRGNR